MESHTLRGLVIPFQGVLHAINFHLLIATAEEAGARERFQKLVADLVRLQQRTVREIRPSPGDWG